MKQIRVLVACECSGRVKTAFRERGFDAWSCDLKPSEIPDDKFHIQGDVLPLLTPEWDLLIAHPPCTYLTVTANRWYLPEYKGRYPNRAQDRLNAIRFFLDFYTYKIPNICIENPVGVMSSVFRKPDQYIQPWQFGDRAVKKTGLWLKKLPLLVPTSIVEPEYKVFNSGTHKSGKSKYPMLWAGKRDKTARSRTFQGIANAMATQWGDYLKAVVSPCPPSTATRQRGEWDEDSLR